MKIWNSIRGRSTKAQSHSDETVGEKDAQPSRASSTRGRKAQTRRKKTSRGFGLFASGPHAPLCKQLKSFAPETVLEIGVGDGSRAIAVLETIAKKKVKTSYHAIDQFEMAGGDVTLKQFHQTLRASGIRPQVFPQPIAQGLTRFAHTIGTADLVLIAVRVDQWQTPEILAVLRRVTHSETVTLYLDGESWRDYRLPTGEETRRAA